MEPIKFKFGMKADLGTTMGFEDEINTNPYEYAFMIIFQTLSIQRLKSISNWWSKSLLN